MARIKLKDGSREIEIEGTEKWVQARLADFYKEKDEHFHLSIYAKN